MPGESSGNILEDFARAFAAAKTESDRREVWAKYTRWQRAEDRRLARLYPPDPPNRECNTAVVSGLLFSNGAGLRPGDFTPYFSFGRERVHIWTHTENEWSSLAVEVSVRPSRGGQVWKTLASCLEIAASFCSACEHIYELHYHWIYRFDAGTPIDEQEFFESGSGKDVVALRGVRSGFVHDLYFIADQADLLELLRRDDGFFVAAQHFLASISSHWFCMICELGSDRSMHHPSHEPASWEAAQVVPRLDVAMVQACRAAEAVLGQPGRNKERVVQRWQSAVSLDPDAIFERVGLSYIDYFYSMYSERNEAAHSRGKVPFEVVRRKVIDAQCFAWQVLSGYLERNGRDRDTAQRLLKLNVALLDREIRGYITKTPEPEYSAARLRRSRERRA